MRRHHFRFVCAGLAVLLLLAGLLVPPASPITSAAGKITPAALSQLQDGAQATFLVYLAAQADLRPAYRIRDWQARGRFVLDALRGVAERTQPAVLVALHEQRVAGHLSYVQSYYVLNLLVVRGDMAAAQALAALPEVAAIYPEPLVVPVLPLETAPAGAHPEAPEWNLVMINADDVWSTYGVTGTGVVVANIDSGVQYTHEALVGQYRGNLGGGNFDHDYNWWDPSDQYDYPAPIQGPYPLGASHGTHTMGVIVGDDGLGNQVGVAPGAQWIAAYGFSGIEGLLSATEWMIAPWQVNDFDPGHPSADPGKRPHVVNNSWGAPGGMQLTESLLEVQRAAGIFATFAAGNSGFDPVTYETVCGSLISPADNPSGFGVGATTAADTIAPFSSRGPNSLRPWLGLYGTGPDVSAPGMYVRSSNPPSGYSSGSGTSYASPHVAGTVALLWSAEPDLAGRVEETAAILRGTAVPKATGEQCGGIPAGQVPNSTFGWGRIDALAAVEMAWQAGTLSGTVTAAGTGAPLDNASVLMQRSGHTLRTETGPAGGYNFPLGQGSYTVTVQAYGYEPWTGTGIGLVQDVTTTLNVALTALPTHTLSGVLQEGALHAEGDPVWGQVGVRDTPVEMTTDPASGTYSATVAEGSYLLRAIARGYVPENRWITVTGDLDEDFSLTPIQTYYVRDSRSPCGPALDWIDATDGTPHALDFQDYVEIQEPGYAFPFYGGTYDVYYVSSNGLLTFERGRPVHIQDLPAMVLPYEGPPNTVIYGFAEMLNPALGGQGMVYHKIVDDRYVVIEFHQVEHWVSGFAETFEFILDTETGVILLQYLEVSRPDFATVGVENGDGSEGVLYSYHNSAGLTDSLAVGFYPIFGPPPADQDEMGVLGTLSGTVYVSGTVTPIPGAVVTATSFLHAFSSTADGAGRYLFPDVCADLYTLGATAMGYSPSAPAQARLRWGGDVVETDLFLGALQPAPVLTKTVTPYVCGEAITYTIAYANEGAGALLGAVLSDTVPGMVVYITSTPPGFYQNGTLTWTLEVPVGGSGEVTVIAAPVIPPAGGAGAAGTEAHLDPVVWTIPNTATLSWDSQSISSSVSFDLILADLYLTKTVSMDNVRPGERVTYTLSYANRGCDFLVAGVLTDVLPAEVAYITSTPPGLYQDGVVTWTVDIPDNSTGEITLLGQLSSTVTPGTTVTNTAHIVFPWFGLALSDTASFQVEEPGRWAVYLPLVLKSP